MKGLSGGIQYRIVLLIAPLIALFLGGLALMENTQHQHMVSLERDAIRERAALFDRLLTLKGQTLENFAYDYSYRDDLAAFVGKPGRPRAELNLDEPLTVQKLDGAWVYDADFHLVYTAFQGFDTPPPDEPLAPDALRALLHHAAFQHFFAKTAAGVLEVCTAPIQPSNDSLRQTPARGYLVVAQRLNPRYLRSLSKLVGGEVALAPDATVADPATGSLRDNPIRFNKILLGPSGQAVATLTVRYRPILIESFHETLDQEYRLTIGFGLLLGALVLTVLFFWVRQPLDLLSRSLAQRDPALLGPLLGQATELGQLARLVRDFFQQQQRLTEEINERRRQEKTLRQYSRALEQSANVVVITDRNGTIEYVNPKFVEVTGYAREEVIGANPRILKSGNTSREQYKALWRTITSGGEWRGELRNRRKDGALYWESISIAPIRDETGAITHFVAIKEDITRRKKIEAALYASELRYRSVFATVGDALFLVDSRDGRILAVNRAACKLYGYSRQEFLTMRDADLAATSATDAGLPHTVSQRLTDRPHRRRDGTVFPADLWVQHFTHRSYKITVAAVRDMTQQKMAERKIIRLSHFYAALSRASAAIMRYAESDKLFWRICQIVVDLEQIQVAWIGLVDSESGRFQPVAHAGATPDYLRYLQRVSIDPSQPGSLGPTGKAFRLGAPNVSNDFLNDPDTQSWRNMTHALDIRAGAAFPLRRNGQVVGCLSAYAAEQNFFEADITELLSNLAGEVSFALDLFEREARRKTDAQRIQHLATHDPLTGLPNRTLLIDRLAQAMHSAHRRQQCVGVLFLDLDHFKTINDTLGHEIGDQLLREVTRRLRACIRQADTLARQGGDEFILVLPDIPEPAAAGRVAEHLLRALRAPFEINDRTLHVDASIGISVYPVDATDPQTLIRFADSAMYQVKESSRAAYAFFTSELNVRVSELFNLTNQLRRALERDEFVLHYQPQIDLATGRLIGAEALIRWQHPERGLTSPLTFIPVAEQSGLIDPIGAWTLLTACVQNRRWQDAGLPATPVAVNLSAKQWLQPHLEDQVIHALDTAGLAPNLLDLEITESLLMRDTDKMVETMHRLQARGVQLAVDDFGIGYSSLSYLKRFPVNRIKIDQSFVRHIPDNPDDTAIATAIIQLGKSLRLIVVAEGVETPEQARFLREQGCDAAQGYYFSKPLPADEFLAYCHEPPRSFRELD